MTWYEWATLMMQMATFALLVGFMISGRSVERLNNCPGPFYDPTVLEALKEAKDECRSLREIVTCCKKCLERT